MVGVAHISGMLLTLITTCHLSAAALRNYSLHVDEIILVARVRILLLRGILLDGSSLAAI